MSERSYTTDEVRLLIETLYEQAVAEAHRRIAADVAAADLSWSLFKRLSYQERLAARLAEMADWCRAQPPHRHFPDDWDPAHVAEVQAWVRDGGWDSAYVAKMHASLREHRRILARFPPPPEPGPVVIEEPEPTLLVGT